MAAPRKLPDVGQLIAWRDLGWTHARMAQHIYDTTGEEVSRSSISAALSRAGKTDTHNRWDDTIPWRVRVPHLKEYPARMLRLLGKRLAGLELTANETSRLDSWLAMLADGNAVVGYDPDNDEQGFHYIDPSPGDGDNGIPIHRPRIYTTAVART